LSNSTLYFSSSSSVSVDGCINLNESKITVNLKGLNISDHGKILLMNSTSNCINVNNSFIISYENIPPCYDFSSNQDSNSLFILIIKSPACSSSTEGNNSNNLQTWQIIIIVIVASVIGIAIIFLSIIFSVPKFRYAILKNQGIRKELKSKIGDTESNERVTTKVEEGIEKLKKEIVELKDDHERVKKNIGW